MEPPVVLPAPWITIFSRVGGQKPDRFKLGFPGTRTGSRTLPSTHEHLVEIGKTDFKPGRPAVIALAGAFSYLHLT